MKKIFVLVSVILILFFSGCSSNQIVTKLVDRPFPVCEELTIYAVATKEFNSKVNPLYLTYLKKKKAEYKEVIESFTKQAKKHNQYCKKIKAKYEELNNASK